MGSPFQNCLWPCHHTAQLSGTLWPRQKSAVTVRLFGVHPPCTGIQSWSQLWVWCLFEWPLLDSVMFHSGRILEVDVCAYISSVMSYTGHRDGAWGIRRIVSRDRNLQSKGACRNICVLEVDVCAYICGVMSHTGHRHRDRGMTDWENRKRKNPVREGM